MPLFAFLVFIIPYSTTNYTPQEVYNKINGLSELNKLLVKSVVFIYFLGAIGLELLKGF